MRIQIQNLILSFISENPGTQISAVVSSLPEVDRSSVSSALTRLTMQGKVHRRTGSNKRFSYTLAADELTPVVTRPEPVCVQISVPKQHIISPEEWKRRFSKAEELLIKAEELLIKGLSRRANQAFLELLDVTSDTTLREKIVRSRDGSVRGLKPSGDGSSVAGRFVGNFHE